uniref:histone acetyltransferase n=1 Tax=Araucaria cunninghamii TaxID=56994 RepID=A0A0D6QU92_ARACU
MAPLAGDGYAMDAADLAGSGNLYATASSGRVAATNSLNGNPLGLQPTKMIPVPGLPSQEQKLPTQEQGQQNQSQNAGVPHGLSILPRGQLHQSQQQQQQKFQHHHNQHQQQGHQYQTHSHQQVQHLQLQQQMSVEKKGIVQNQSESMVSGEKQGGVEARLVEASQRELPDQNSFSLPPSEQQKLPVNDPLVQQSEVSNDNPLKSQQLSPEQSQKLHKLQALSNEEQKRQSFNVYNDLPAQVKSEVSLQREQELQSQEKLQLSQQSQSFIEDQQPPQQEPPQVRDQEMTQQHQPCQQVLGNGAVLSASSQQGCGTTGAAGGPPAGNVQHNDNADQRKMQYAKHQRWLLFLRHASKCTVPEGQCQTPHCSIARELWAHITQCRDRQCSYPRCHASRTLLSHHQRCRDRNCPLCGPVRELLMRQRANVQCQSSNPGASDFVNAVSKSSNLNATVGNNINLPSSSRTSIHDKTKDQEPPMKKAKIEPTSPSYAQQQLENTLASVINPSEMQGFNQMQTQGFQPSGHDAGLVKVEVSQSIKSDAAPMKIDQVVDSEQVPLTRCKL